MRLLLVYKPGCPNCGGPIGEDRLNQGLPCARCLPSPPETGTSFEERVLSIGEALEKRGVLRGYWLLYRTVKLLKDFEEFFEKATGSKLWSAQRTWAQRLLAGESLALVAPTGVGKTTLLTVYTLYTASKGLKAYYVVPTGNLVAQVTGRLKAYINRLNLGIRIASFSSIMPRRLRVEELSRIEAGDYDVLVTTVSFLTSKWRLVEGRLFDLIVVDDVDAVLKNSKNIDKLLQLLGFRQSSIETGLEIVKARIKASIAKSLGRLELYEKLLERIKELESKLANTLLDSKIGQLVIASATGRARGLKPKLFKELLGFDIGRVYDTVRNIANLYTVSDNPATHAAKLVAELVAKYGLSGLVFVSQMAGKDTARQITRELEELGVRAGLALSGTRSLEAYARGDYDVLVGIASYYGVIVRGLDMPERVYFTVFVEPPAQKVRLDTALNSPLRLARITLALGLPEASDLVKTLSRLGPGELTALRIALEKDDVLEGRLGQILEKLRLVRRKVASMLEELASTRNTIVLEAAAALVRRIDDTLYYIIPDAATYVQASGRASRLLGSHMTRGISIIVTSIPELLKLLSTRLRRYVETSSFTELSTSILEKEVEEARRTRSGGGSKPLQVESTLIIVESPTKAKTIARFFGKPVRRRIGSLVAYETTFYNPVDGKVYVATITATKGHIYDLTIDDDGVYGVEVEKATFKPVYVPIKQCLSCGTQFASSLNTCPRCGSTNIVSKEDVVDGLRKLASEVDTVYIATDPDTEGEKIAYDVYLLLKPVSRRIARIELHEITKRELFKALAAPREVSRPLSYAQVVRRVEDRWIGFGLSRILWQKFGKNWLGAGRVQTPVLGWIIERYREWKARRGYIVLARLENGLKIRILLGDRETAERIAESISTNGVRVLKVTLEEIVLNPPPPYTTETLIHDASVRLGYTSEKTMRIAQDLFESGLITYHRTDSTHVSSLGIDIARKYLESRGLKVKPRQWGPQGHHEAIRPTQPYDVVKLRELVATGELRPPIPLREPHYRLYDLVFRRFIASQMEAERGHRVEAVLDVGGLKININYIAVGRESQGFTAVYAPVGIHRGVMLRPGMVLQAESVKLYRGSELRLLTHGDVVLMMRDRGIGRPSTYARTIEQLKRHGYVIESKYRKYLVPTRLGIEVYDYLTAMYRDLVSEDRTRQVERRMEMIEAGVLEPGQVLVDLLLEFAQTLGDDKMSSGLRSLGLATLSS